MFLINPHLFSRTALYVLRRGAVTHARKAVQTLISDCPLIDARKEHEHSAGGTDRPDNTPDRTRPCLHQNSRGSDGQEKMVVAASRGSRVGSARKLVTKTHGQVARHGGSARNRRARKEGRGRREANYAEQLIIVGQVPPRGPPQPACSPRPYMVAKPGRRKAHPDCQRR